MAADGYHLVTAIDIGSTYSVYAFQSTHPHASRNPMDGIRCPTVWPYDVNDSVRNISWKTPTCVLLNSNTDLEGFGYAAGNRYSELCQEADHLLGNWYFFRRFKLSLNREKVRIIVFPFFNLVYPFLDWWQTLD